MLECPKCGSWDTVMVGWDDGGGISGDSVCETHLCEECDYEWDGACVDSIDDDVPEPQPVSWQRKH